MKTNTLNKTGILLGLLLLFCTAAVMAQPTASLSGRLYEANGQYGARVLMVTARKDSATYKTLTDTTGRFTFRQIPTGIYRLQIESQFYTANTRSIHLQHDQSIDLLIERVAVTLQDVYITASESKGMSSASVIDRKAMQHLQPSSLTDLLELLPGGRAKDPNLTSTNRVRLREVGVESDAYDITSLGTAFLVDGAPINTSANLLNTEDYTLSGPNNTRLRTINRGVDMRTIATDQIEKVEVTRGIASAEYGDLTSGLIQITRKKGATPYTARIKSDGFSKLFSLGKGFFIPSRNLMVNVDLGYLNAKDEPTNNFLTYQRINGSVRLNKTWANSRRQLKWSTNLDYATNIDNERVDPENGYAPVDKYVSRNNTYGLTTLLSNDIKGKGWMKYWEVMGSVTYTNTPVDQTKWVQPKSIGIRFNATTAGEHDLGYMGGGYAARLQIDDQPLNTYFKAMTRLEFATAGIRHQAKLGLETRFSKNLGDGQLYDINYPMNPDGIPVRPRPYNSILGMLNQSFFAEDMFTLYLGNHQVTTAAGLRGMSLLGMDRQYTIANKVYIDPRVNVQWQLPRTLVAGKPMLITLGGGYGVHTKMPTLDHLYPNDLYEDIVQLNFYDNNPAYRKANAITYIIDRRNFDLTPAINYKWEINSNIEWAGNRLSVTYFKERMGSGFRNMSRYQVLAYKKYDEESVDGNTLTAPPQTSDFSYTEEARYFPYGVPSNGSRLNKEGIEYQFTSKRISRINTRFTVNGAWFNSTYVSGLETYESLTGNQVAEEYVGKYIGIFSDDNRDSYLRQQLNTNLTIDSYLPKLGLIISTSLQNIWFFSRQNAPASSLPTDYMDINGKVYPYTPESQQDGNLKLLDRMLSATYDDKTTIPIDLQGNIKVTKKFRNTATISMFVNRLFTYTPPYTNNGVRIRRSGFSSPYFGMELNLEF